jgi:hypothetical protein
MGKCGDIVGVWMDPVMAQVMMTFFLGRELMVLRLRVEMMAGASSALGFLKRMSRAKKCP